MTHAEQLAAIERDMQGKIARRDWHGVADCAMDLRELEAEERGRRESQANPPTDTKSMFWVRNP